jgi:hypothetical protein
VFAYSAELKFSHLPVEVLTKIFSYIDNKKDLYAVCQAFENCGSTEAKITEAIYHPISWEELYLESECLTQNFIDFCINNNSVRYIQHASLCNIVRNETRPGQVECKISELTNLVTLDVTDNSYVHDATFLSGLSIVQSLDVTRCHNISADSLKVGLRENTSLTKLVLNGCGQLSQSDIIEMASNTKLVWLEAENTDQFSPSNCSKLVSSVHTLKWLSVTPKFDTSISWSSVIWNHPDVTFGHAIWDYAKEARL